ncbi:MAG: hypothetical protein R3E36_10120 [Nitrosomonas sp.]|nr:hypothetical protein [Nitrosomonas sp.]
MSSGQGWNPRSAWRQFRLEAETAKNYPTSYALYVGSTHRDILLEQLLPTLLYIKAASILDDSLSIWLTDNGHVLKNPYKNDFNGRICYLDDNSIYGKCAELHNVRRKRNAFAHEPKVKSNWQELESGVLTIEECLVFLGLAAETKKLEYFAERSGMQGADDPNVAFTRRFSYGVKEDGKLALEIAWNENTLNE